MLANEWHWLAVAPRNGEWPFVNHLEELVVGDFAAEIVDDNSVLAFVALISPEG